MTKTLTESMRSHMNLLNSSHSMVAEMPFPRHWVVKLDSTDVIDFFLVDSELTGHKLSRYIDKSGYGSAYSGANAEVMPMDQAPAAVQSANFESILTGEEMGRLMQGEPNMDNLPQEGSYNVVFGPEELEDPEVGPSETTLY